MGVFLPNKVNVFLGIPAKVNIAHFRSISKDKAATAWSAGALFSSLFPPFSAAGSNPIPNASSNMANTRGIGRKQTRNWIAPDSRKPGSSTGQEAALGSQCSNCEFVWACVACRVQANLIRTKLFFGGTQSNRISQFPAQLRLTRKFRHGRNKYGWFGACRFLGRARQSRDGLMESCTCHNGGHPLLWDPRPTLTRRPSPTLRPLHPHSRPPYPELILSLDGMMWSRDGGWLSAFTLTKPTCLVRNTQKFRYPGCFRTFTGFTG